MGAAATGVQQIGAVVSITGSAFGMSPIVPTVLTYVKEVGTLPLVRVR
jgi:hypothetical protein